MPFNHRAPRGSSRRDRRRHRTTSLIVVGTLFVVLVGAGSLLLIHDAAPDAVADLATEPDTGDPAIDIDTVVSNRLENVLGRRNYRYSVIPGGAYDAVELKAAIERDVVVAAHYRGLDPSRVRVETVAHDRYVHVSYRKGDRIFWTKKPVLLRQGETILTDGKTQIRTRCGNCISEEPLLPVAEDEPETVEFDQLEEPEGSPLTSEVALADPIPPADVPSEMPSQAATLLEPLAPLAGGRFGVASLPPIAAGIRSADPTDTDAPPTPPATTPPPVSELPPFSDIPQPPPPGSGQPLIPTEQILVPPGTPPSDSTPPWHEDPPVVPPGQPVPVPEPGAVLLVGGAVLVFVRRHLRSRSR